MHRIILTAAVWLAASAAAADEQPRLTAETPAGDTVTIERSTGGGTVIRDASGRTVGRVVRETGGALAVRDRRGRTVLRIK